MEIRPFLLAAVGLFLLSGVVANLPAALAQPHVTVRFGIDVLQASNPDRIDPAWRWTPVPRPPHVTPAPPPWVWMAPGDPLRRALPQLERLFRYREYRTLARLSSEGPLGVAQRVAIPGDASLDLTAEGLLARRVKFWAQLRERNHIELRTGVLAPPLAPTILGGPPRGNGVLIIVLSAQPSW